MSFFVQKIKEREAFIDSRASSPAEHKELLQELHSLASTMAAAGVETEKDYKDFFYITALTGEASRNITATPLSEEQLAKISHVMYENRSEYPINTIINFHKAVKNAMDKSEIPIKKKAYPQGQGSDYISSPHNLQKWVQTMRKIYALNTQGHGLGQAFTIATEKWDKMEKRDFRHWLDFYQSGQHLDYKLAAPSYLEIGNGAMLPRASIKGFPPIVMGNEDEEQEVPTGTTPEQAATLRLYERAKQLIGRLNAAEKIFTKDVDFRRMLGNQFEPWLAKLHELKRSIQTTPINSGRMSYATMQDMIIKSSNQLYAEGYDKSAKVMRKLAQAPPPPAAGAPPGGDLLSDMPGDMSPGGDVQQKSDPEGAMKEFLANLGAEDPEDEEAKQAEKAADINDGAIIVISEDDDGRLTAHGQMEPMPAEPMPAPEAPVEEAPEETKGDSRAVDSAIEGALENVTLNDLIAKLEGSASLYKQRPLARDLTMADLYMQALGISSYFPEMAEATKSALDSNQYVLTRVEQILAKLRGAATGGSIEDIKAKLETQDNKQQKKMEQKEIEQMTPEAPVEAPPPGEAPEMAAPAEVERPPEGIRVR